METTMRAAVAESSESSPAPGITVAAAHRYMEADQATGEVVVRLR